MRILKKLNNWQKYIFEISNFFYIREMQIQTTLRFYLTPVRMATTDKQITANAGVEMVVWI